MAGPFVRMEVGAAGTARRGVSRTGSAVAGTAEVGRGVRARAGRWARRRGGAVCSASLDAAGGTAGDGLFGLDVEHGLADLGGGGDALDAVAFADDEGGDDADAVGGGG